MKYRSVFISDLHLGTKIAQTEKLLDFLRDNEFDRLFLVGDIVDMFAIRRHMFHWDESHNTVIQKFLRLARKGVKIVYIIGNHDIYIEFLVKEDFGRIRIRERDSYTTAAGERCLIMHGHQLDGAIRKIPWLYWLGDTMYSVALFMNRMLNFAQRLFGFDEWSLSLYLKTKVKNVIQFINNYERLVIREVKASKTPVDTVIVGHIHMAEDKLIEGIRYLNCGCWTEFCSAIVEEEDGKLTLLRI